MYIHEIKQISPYISNEELDMKLDKHFAEWFENNVSSEIVMLMQQLIINNVRILNLHPFVLFIGT